MHRTVNKNLLKKNRSTGVDFPSGRVKKILTASVFGSNSFFKFLVPPRCSFLTIARHSKPFSATTISAADEMIADLNCSHSLLMSSVDSRSCLNLDGMLDAICFLTSLFSEASYLKKTCWIFCLAKTSKIANRFLNLENRLTKLLD